MPTSNRKRLCASAVAKLGVPSILKTRRFGYDGKGQIKIKAAEGLAALWRDLASHSAILEAFVPFEREVSRWLSPETMTAASNASTSLKTSTAITS